MDFRLRLFYTYLILNRKKHGKPAIEDIFKENCERFERKGNN